MKKEQQEALFRILVLIICGIISYVWGMLAGVLIIFNIIYTLIFGYRNKAIAEFLEYWNSFIYSVSKYLSGMTNKRPFPFSPLVIISKYEK